MPSKIGTIQNAVLCDDIRQEQGTNKHFLIGVFSGDLVVPSFPGAVAPALYVEYAAQKSGVYEFSVTYTIGGKATTPIKGNLNVLRPGVTALSLPQFLIEVTKPTDFEISLTVGGEKPITLVKKRIISPEVAPTHSPPL